MPDYCTVKHDGFCMGGILPTGICQAGDERNRKGTPIPILERAVIEAALAYRKANTRYNDAYLQKQETQVLAQEQYDTGKTFFEAVDALISARKEQ